MRSARGRQTSAGFEIYHDEDGGNEPRLNVYEDGNVATQQFESSMPLHYSQVSETEEGMEDEEMHEDENKDLNLPREDTIGMLQPVTRGATAATRVVNTFSSRRVVLSIDDDDDDLNDTENRSGHVDDPEILSKWKVQNSLLWSILTHLPAQAYEDLGKLTVVLDLDETLIYAADARTCDFSRLRLTGSEGASNNVFPVKLQEGYVVVHKRPSLDRFLRRASKRFELVLFTAGTRDYAERILGKLDPHKKLFRHYLTREHCMMDSNNFVKDLHVVNRSLKRTVLVDNNPQSFISTQKANGILIRSFDKSNLHEDDRQLVALYKVLKVLMVQDDVREALADWNTLQENTNTSIRSQASLPGATAVKHE